MIDFKRDNTPTQIGIRVPMFIKNEAEDTAARMGVARSDFYRDAIFFYGSLDPEFLKDLERFAYGKLHISTSLVVQNLVWRRLAEIQAYNEVCGDAAELPEFKLTGKGMLTGKEYFNEQLNLFRKKFTEEKTKE